MYETNFQPIFEYLDDVKLELKSDINRVEIKVDVLQASVDGLAKITENLGEEMVVTNRRLEVLEARVL